MKILVVCQYYHPEPFRIHEVCESLAKRGHRVTVLTGLPNYPMGIIPEEQLVQGVSPKIDMSECIMCLRCVSACPHNAATVRFRWQKRKAVPGQLPPACAAQKEDKI